MRTIAMAVVATAGLLGLGSAYAADGLYFGANFSSVTYKEDGFPSAKPTTLALKLGNQFNKNLAVEGRFGFGLSGDTVTVSGIPIEFEIDNYFGIYGKGILPLSEVFSVYGLVGFTSGKATASAFGVSISESDSDVSFGFGADFAVSKSTAINVEWAKLFEGTGYKVEALSIGVNFKF